MNSSEEDSNSGTNMYFQKYKLIKLSGKGMVLLKADV